MTKLLKSDKPGKCRIWPSLATDNFSGNMVIRSIRPARLC